MARDKKGPDKGADPKPQDPKAAPAPEASPQDKYSTPPFHPDPGVTNPQPPGAPQTKSDQGEIKRAVTETDDARTALTKEQRDAYEAGRERTAADAQPPSGVKTRADGTQDPNTTQEPARVPDAVTPPGATPTKITDVPKPPDERRVDGTSPPALIDPHLGQPAATPAEGGDMASQIRSFRDARRKDGRRITMDQVRFLEAHGADARVFAGMSETQLASFFEAACAAHAAGPKGIPTG